jgi:hypothetical protein
LEGAEESAAVGYVVVGMAGRWSEWGVSGEKGEGGMERKEDLKGLGLMVRVRLDLSSGMLIGVC